jgi:hypothetical protein
MSFVAAVQVCLQLVRFIGAMRAKIFQLILVQKAGRFVFGDIYNFAANIQQLRKVLLIFFALFLQSRYH